MRFCSILLLFISVVADYPRRVEESVASTGKISGSRSRERKKDTADVALDTDVLTSSNPSSNGRETSSILRATKSSASVTDHDSEPIRDAVVVMALGRGGSTWFCEIIAGTSLNNTANLKKELLGQNRKEMDAIQDPTAVIKSYFMQQRITHPTGLIGFKWKPTKFDEPKYHTARLWLAEKKVKVILMQRNILDLHLSALKHATSNVSIPAHCFKGDDKCVQKHKSVALYVDTDHLIKKLDILMNSARTTRAELERAKLHFTSVSYDDLAFGLEKTRLKILQEVIDFVYPDKHPQIKATMELFNSSSFEATHDRSHANSIRNYDEIVQVLKGTEYENMLH